LSLVLDVLVNVVCPPVLAQWFLTDLVRRITEIALGIFNYCLSPSCPTTAAKRSRSLGQVIALVTPLLSLSGDFETALANLPYRLLRYRLEEGPKADRTTVDLILSKTLESPLRFPPAKANVTDTLEALRKQIWGITGKELYVSRMHLLCGRIVTNMLPKALAISYLRICLPHMDLDTLRALKEANSTIDLGHQWAALGAEIERHISLTNPHSDRAADEPRAREVSLWRQHVRTSTQEIIAPDQITWMDEDEGLTDDQFAQRAVDDIKERFGRLVVSCSKFSMLTSHAYRPLSETSALARISLAEKLAEFPCLLSHFGSSDCLCKSETPAISTIPLGHSVVARLLDGAKDEVTSVVRRRVYNALGRLVRHHPLGSYDGLENATEMIIHGIIDKDRSVRLSAG